MRVAIMQPYFLPYIGYWQLIASVDRFVILDDVNYIMRGYINRNEILLDGKRHRFTIPVEKASQNKLISNSYFLLNDETREKILLLFKNAYQKAPYFDSVYPMICDIVNFSDTSIVGSVKYSINRIISYLGLTTEILVSSKIEKDNSLTGQDRILEICKRIGADTYINPCGGRALYKHSCFNEENIKLFFLDTRTDAIVYNQRCEKFEKNLSILDILMYNDIEIIKEYLKECDFNE